LDNLISYSYDRRELTCINIGITFLNKLGFKETFTIDKHRESFSYKDFVIDLDSIDKLGNFIEIEKTISSADEKEEAREECINLLNSISPNSKIENKKYGDLMQELINENNSNNSANL